MDEEKGEGRPWGGFLRKSQAKHVMPFTQQHGTWPQGGKIVREVLEEEAGRLA